MRQAPPSYSESVTGSESTDTTPVYTLNVYEETWKTDIDVESRTSEVSNPFPNDTKSLCWSFLITFIIMLLVIPFLCFLLYLCRNVLNYDPNQNLM